MRCIVFCGIVFDLALEMAHPSMDHAAFQWSVAFLPEVHFSESVPSTFCILQGMPVHVAVIETAHVLTTIVVVIVLVEACKISASWMA